MQDDSTREIPLTRGKVAIIDAADYERVSGYKWHACRPSKLNIWYARSHVGKRPSRRFIHLHRIILDAPDGLQVDHVDGDGLNCRRSNMRVATRSQNQANKGKYRNNTSGFKGVCLAQGRWIAQIGHNRKVVYIGSYDTAEEAARAYDARAIELFGEFAGINFPRGEYTL